MVPALHPDRPVDVAADAEAAAGDELEEDLLVGGAGEAAVGEGDGELLPAAVARAPAFAGRLFETATFPGDRDRAAAPEERPSGERAARLRAVQRRLATSGRVFVRFGQVLASRLIPLRDVLGRRREHRVEVS